MKTINLLVLSLLFANSTEALRMRESNNIEERTISEALNEVDHHQMKHKHHHKHESDSDEEIQTKASGEASAAVSKSISLAQEAMEVIAKSKGTPQEDAKMRNFINDMKAKKTEGEVPSTLNYRLKVGIKEQAGLDPSEAPHVVDQAIKEADYHNANPDQKITQEQIKPVGGKDQLPTYEDKNSKSLIDAHNDHLDMHGNAPKAPIGAKSEDKIASDKKPEVKPLATTVKKETESLGVAKTTVLNDKAPTAPGAGVGAASALVQTKTALSDMEKNFENTFQDVMALHTSSVDLLTADSSFHKLSHLSDPEKDYRTLDKTMAEMAYLDVLDKYDLTMTDDEEKSFYKRHFEPAWAKYSDGTTLEYDKTPGFFQMLKQKVE